VWGRVVLVYVVLCSRVFRLLWLAVAMGSPKVVTRAGVFSLLVLADGIQRGLD